MRFTVLGDVGVEHDDAPVRLGGPQQRRLLALLLSERGRVVSTDRIVDALWSVDEPPAGAARSAMKYVSRLRAALGEQVVVTAGPGYRLELDGHRCDADEFEALVGAAGREMPDVAVTRYDRALQLWRGPAYGEFGDEWWARPVAARLEERRLAAEMARAAALLAMGHHNEALPDLEHLALAHPLDERPVRLLMQALQATGRQAEALRVGRGFRRRLAGQAGLEPTADLARLEAAIATGEESTEAARGRPLRGYTIHDPIGEGAHGRVYVATQPGTERRVAIKVIRPDVADSNQFIRRFESEARLVARLEHPHIVPLYDYWREPGAAYLVFRFLSGGTARGSVISGGPWSLPRVSRLLEDVGAALLYAHAAGIVHNDVKASNVLLDEDGAAYLTDFGIASIADDPGEGVAADISGIGWLAWELLTGGRPAERSGRSTLGAPSAAREIPSLVGRMRAVPDGLDAVLRRVGCGGYESVAEFLLAWRAATADVGGRHSPLPSDERRVAARQLTDAALAGVNPYRGLSPFDEADASRFYGRDDVVAALVELVEDRRFVSVVGASGSGKSSAVLAGLVPVLRSRGATVATMIPGDAPVDALRAALGEVATVADHIDGDVTAAALTDIARRAGRLVVVVDQFEECWTTESPLRRETFLDVAATAVADESVDVRFVTTVRADLLDRPLEHRRIGPLLAAGSYVLPPLSALELEEAILRPAERAGVMFEPGVVSDLIAEASVSPGALPLLQFTLTELYDRRRDGTIGRRPLADLGGLAGALGRRAEECFAGLDDALRPEARSLFGRLVTAGAGGPDTRRRAVLSELPDGARTVAERFVSARLIVADRDPTTREPTVEVAHEALLTHWPRLVAWVDEDRSWLIQLQHLSAAARAWDEAGRTEAELYRGSRLEAAIEAIERDGRPASELEVEFVAAGRHARDSEVRSARRTAHRLRRLLVAVGVALVVALAAGTVALVQRRQAIDNAAESRVQTERAEAAALAAEIEALVGRAESLRATQRDAAALLAVEAFRLADTPRTRSALLGTFTEDPTFYDARRHVGTTGGAGIVMPDGAAYLTDDVGRLRPYDLDTGSLGDPWPGLDGDPGASSVLAASADGRWLVQAQRADLEVGPTTIGVFDTRRRSLSFPALIVDGVVSSATFVPRTNDLALAIGEDARLVVIDAATGIERARADGVAVPELGGEPGLEPQLGSSGFLRRPSAVAAAEGDLMLGAADGSLRVFDAATYELRRTLALAPGTLSALHPLGDGTLLTAGRLGVARIDTGSGRPLWHHEQGLSSVGDGSSGSTCVHLAVIEERGAFYCGNAYGRLAEHDLVSGFAVRALNAQNGNSGSLWVARNGTELITFGDNEPVVSRWRVDGSGPITHLVAPGFKGWSFSPNGDLLLVERGRALEAETNVIDAASGAVVRVLDGLINADWLDDDTVIGASVSDQGDIHVAGYELESGELIVRDEHTVDPVPSRAGLDTGKELMLFVYRDGSDALLRAFDPEELRFGPDIAVDGYVSSAISRSGHRIAAGTVRGVEIYDGFTGERVGDLPGADRGGVAITVADQLFVSSLGGELTLYDLDALEPVRTFGGSRGYITQLVGTPDGSLIATTGGDHQVILYDVATGLRIGTPITVPDGDSNWIALSLDGRWLSVGGEAADGHRASQIWSLDPRDWVDAACRLAGRNLTRVEWSSNIGALAPYRATCPAFDAEP